ncbi:metallophosphoesterase [Paenibacillus antri]|uniref:Metallophosphoesterase n=1 Tax=Paenibacillus antri TaxID=2582848 RepID=A0A5R9GEG5_9BACL|nr:metallophosphoesterase family protein [Paenibacillus antri]TLS51604.1 metallophosphoesterase [Paenibacillus antri]
MSDGLTLRPDGSFTIVQFTDVHWKNGDEKDFRSEALMRNVLAAEAPDLVVYTGDLIQAAHCLDPLAAIRSAVRAAEESRIPWAAVFGNHDPEGTATRLELLGALQEGSYCRMERGPEDIHGVGNYVLDVVDPSDGAEAASLYFFDSGMNAPHSVGGYDWVRSDQVEWFRAQALARRARRADASPSLAFLHIPFPEYNDVWNHRVCYGSKYEAVCCPRVNSGLFSAFVEDGTVRGVFAGHDHVNDYWGELHGVGLYYGRATGYNTYGREGFPRGARVIQLRRIEGELRLGSWLRLDDGTRVDVQEPHPPAAESWDPYIEAGV